MRGSEQRGSSISIPKKHRFELTEQASAEDCKYFHALAAVSQEKGFIGVHTVESDNFSDLVHKPMNK